MVVFNKTIQLKQSWAKHLLWAAIAAALAYCFGSWAIDSGSGWHYLLATIFLFGSITSFVKAIKGHDKR